MLNLEQEAYYAREAYAQHQASNPYLPAWYELDDYDRCYWLKWYPWCGQHSPMPATNPQLQKAYELYKKAGHLDNFRHLPLKAKAEWLRLAIKQVPTPTYSHEWTEIVRKAHS